MQLDLQFFLILSLLGRSAADRRAGVDRFGHGSKPRPPCAADRRTAHDLVPSAAGVDIAIEVVRLPESRPEVPPAVVDRQPISGPHATTPDVLLLLAVFARRARTGRGDHGRDTSMLTRGWWIDGERFELFWATALTGTNRRSRRSHVAGDLLRIYGTIFASVNPVHHRAF